jgi:hypothetical protein
MKKLLKTMAMLMVAGLLADCGGGGGGGGGNNAPADPAALDDLRLSAGALDQVFQSTHFNYSSTVGYLATATTVTPTTADAGATVTVNGDAVPSGHASDPIVLTVGVNDITIVVTAADGVTTDTYKVTVTRESADQFAQRAYIKASNTDSKDEFGYSVALSGDTLAVGAIGEASNATGVNGDQNSNSAANAGAVYVFTRSGVTWTQQAYVKASNIGSGDEFGYSVALSGDTLAVGAIGEASNATGVNGNQNNNSVLNAGAVYVFTRSGVKWTQQAYIKASNTGQDDAFGWSVALSGDTLAVGAIGEASNATGVNGDQNNNIVANAGAVYVFTRSGVTWTQQAYVKASNTDSKDAFGYSVALSGDTLAVGATGEASQATGTSGDAGAQADNSAIEAGAVYVFTRSGVTWTQQAYVKASNTDSQAKFGYAVALSGDTLAVGAIGEASNATGVNGDQNNISAAGAGAVYVFTRNGVTWTQQAYVKASNTASGDNFGYSASLSGDMLAVGAPGRDTGTGAGYLFTRSAGAWSQVADFTAADPVTGDSFGSSLALSVDTLAVGARGENSAAVGIDGDQTDVSLDQAGAVFTFQ